ncbi:MAG: hypothetical protein HY540_02365, partial [Deltaproteobacteria bacterium]|nr:hypothetical protein [Deltaproteobacteria bacterium]
MKFNFPFIKFQTPFLLVSVLAMAASLFMVFTKGFNYGIDFEGGAKLEYQFKQNVSEDDVRRALSDLNLGEMSIVRFGSPEEQRLSIKVKLPEQHADLGQQLTSALEKKFGQGNLMLEREETVGPRVGKELRKKAWLTILFSWVLMLIYIGYRFDFLFAPGAVIALIHDVLI